MSFKMKYDITQNFIPNLPQIPYRNGRGAYEGTICHATASWEDSATGEENYESSHFNDAFVHFFVDHESIIQVADTDFIAWGAGSVANQRYVHVELCQSKDKDKFEQAYARYIWLHAYLLYSRGLDVIEGETLWSHHMVTEQLGGTTHIDPDEYLEYHGKSWADCVVDIKREYGECIEAQESDIVEFSYDYQWDILKQILQNAYDKSVSGEINPAVLSDYGWCQMAYDENMKTSDLAWLAITLWAKNEGILPE